MLPDAQKIIFSGTYKDAGVAPIIRARTHSHTRTHTRTHTHTHTRTHAHTHTHTRTNFVQPPGLILLCFVTAGKLLKDDDTLEKFNFKETDFVVVMGGKVGPNILNNVL